MYYNIDIIKIANRTIRTKSYQSYYYKKSTIGAISTIGTNSQDLRKGHS